MGLDCPSSSRSTYLEHYPEVLREAIALYLKKAKAVSARSRLELLEEKVSRLTALLLNQLIA